MIPAYRLHLTGSTRALRSRRRARRQAARLARALQVLGRGSEREPPATDADFRPPRPWVVAATVLTPIAGPLLLGVAGLLPVPVVLAATAPLLAVGLVLVALSWGDLRRSRRLADRLLLQPEARQSSPLAAWRAAELAQERRRSQR